MDAFEERLHSFSGGDVLDVGTGCGACIEILAEHLADYRQIVGVDVQVSRLADAVKERRQPNVSFAAMDAYRLAVPDNSFDIVVISDSLHHLDYPEQVLKELYRVTRPGGRLIVIEMFRDHQTDLQMTYVNMHHWWASIDRRAGITHNETLTRNDITKLVGNIGLHDLEAIELAGEPENPLDGKLLSQFDELIDSYPDKVDGHADQERLRAEGEMIKAQLHENGMKWATELALIGVK